MGVLWVDKETPRVWMYYYKDEYSSTKNASTMPQNQFTSSLST